MLFPYWITFFLPVFAFPLISHRHHAEIFALERNGIAADNAAIRLGEGEVAWLAFLDEQNQALKQWDQAHHILHACAAVPIAGAECRAADLLWENAIRARHMGVGFELQARWYRSRAAAQAEIGRVGGEGVLIIRLPVAPVLPTRCSVCQLPVAWRLIAPPDSQIRVPKNPPQTVWVHAQRGHYELY